VLRNQFRNNMASTAIVDVARPKSLNTSIVSSEQVCSVNRPVPLISPQTVPGFSAGKTTPCSWVGFSRGSDMVAGLLTGLTIAIPLSTKVRSSRLV
jgi:hypothetical protein